MLSSGAGLDMREVGEGEEQETPSHIYITQRPRQQSKQSRAWTYPSAHRRVIQEPVVIYIRLSNLLTSRFRFRGVSPRGINSMVVYNVVWFVPKDRTVIHRIRIDIVTHSSLHICTCQRREHQDRRRGDPSSEGNLS